VRGDGGIVIAPPSERPGKGFYKWANDDPVADAPDWLIALATAAGDAEDHVANKDLLGDPAEVAAALDAIPNDDLDWESWNRIGMATWCATGGSEDGFAAFDRWSQKSKKHNKNEKTRDRWDGYAKSTPDSIGFGTLVFEASKAQPGWRDPFQTVNAPLLSEEALALQFTNRHKHNTRFVAPWGKWLRWDGKQWKADEKRQVYSLARDLCRDVAHNSKKAKTIANAKTRAAVVSLVSDDQEIAATIDQWDADPWLLNTPGGVVDLKKQTYRPHRASDYMTKMTAVAPDRKCATPLWSAFLDTVTRGDKELQRYLARKGGYALTGITSEHVLFFIYGTGANGKGVFINTIADILGDYHRTAPIETFTITNTEQHPTEMAMLRGARFVTATETEEGRRCAESRIKMLTGGDPVPARFMRQDFFEYVPQFKLTISGNHKLSVRSVDEAIKRRINLVPFNVTIKEEDRDPDLRDKLRAEWPGILVWMIDGCLDWQANGLRPPKAVTDATDAYLQDEDAICQWYEERCIADNQAELATSKLFENWKQWAEVRGEYVGNQKRFKQRLETLGDRHSFKWVRQKSFRGFQGLRLRTVGEMVDA
jgi:putative DNA primase/helicase